MVNNSNADLLLDRYFWPAGVIYKPWKNKAERLAAYRVNRYRSNPRDYISSRTRSTFGRSDIDDYNPYSPLRDSLNIDA